MGQYMNTIYGAIYGCGIWIQGSVQENIWSNIYGNICDSIHIFLLYVFDIKTTILKRFGCTQNHYSTQPTIWMWFIDFEDCQASSKFMFWLETNPCKLNGQLGYKQEWMCKQAWVKLLIFLLRWTQYFACIP